MKYITRELKIYKYTFGKVNVDNNTVYGLFTHETAEPLSKRGIGKICEENDGAVLLKTDEVLQKFAMPLDRFVSECREYNAASIPEDDQEQAGEAED